MERPCADGGDSGGTGEGAGGGDGAGAPGAGESAELPPHPVSAAVSAIEDLVRNSRRFIIVFSADVL